MDDMNIKIMRDALGKCITGWEEDGHVPANFVRKTGMGEEVARVDRWCGGFQDPHHPITIGWKARVGNKSQSGVVPTASYSDEDVAIEDAQCLADKALAELRKGR